MEPYTQFPKENSHTIITNELKNKHFYITAQWKYKYLHLLNYEELLA